MELKKTAAACCVVLALAACAGAETPAQMVFAAKSRYEIVLSAAVEYEGLPRCTRPDAPAACSDPDIVAIIRTADTAADAALDNAESVVRNPAATEDALSLAAASATAALATLVDVLIAIGLEVEE